MNSQNYPENPAFIPSDYEICVNGRLSQQGAVWFEDMILSINEETTPPKPSSEVTSSTRLPCMA